MRETKNLQHMPSFIFTDPPVDSGDMMIAVILTVAAFSLVGYGLSLVKPVLTGSTIQSASLVKPALVEITIKPTLAPPVLVVVPAPAPSSSLPTHLPFTLDECKDWIVRLATWLQQIDHDVEALPVVNWIPWLVIGGCVGWGLYKVVKLFIDPPTLPVFGSPSPGVDVHTSLPPKGPTCGSFPPLPPPDENSEPDDDDDGDALWWLRVLVILLGYLNSGLNWSIQLMSAHPDDDEIMTARYAVRFSHRLRFLINNYLRFLRRAEDPLLQNTFREYYRTFVHQTQTLADLVEIETGEFISFTSSITEQLEIGELLSLLASVTGGGLL